MPKENLCVWQLYKQLLFLKRLRRFDNFTWFYTTSTNFLSVTSAIGKLDTNLLQVRIEAATSFIIRVWNIISKLRTFAADGASFSHSICLQNIKTR